MLWKVRYALIKLLVGKYGVVMNADIKGTIYMDEAKGAIVNNVSIMNAKG